jgi:exodeoxyribonuclease VIII
MKQPGIYDNLDIMEYHDTDGISSSGISLMLDCPARYHYEYYIKPKEIDVKKERDKYKLGRAVHMLILEPKKFDDLFYCMKEKVNLVTKVGKEIYAQAEIEAAGREILRVGDFEASLGIAEEISQHDTWKKINKNGKVEQSIYWRGGVYNTLLKARPDFFNDQIILDVKTTDDLNRFDARNVVKYGYHRQAAMQVDACKSIDGIERHFALVVVEKKAPHLVKFIGLNQWIDQGREEYLRAAALYKECLETDNWPGYGDKFVELEMPEWACKMREDKELPF